MNENLMLEIINQLQLLNDKMATVEANTRRV